MEEDCVREERHDEMNGLECVPNECRSMYDDVAVTIF